MTKSKICWLIVYFSIVVLVLLLFFYRPAYYKPVPAEHGRRLSPYLTHYLIPQFYNGIQLQEPFDIAITQQGVNEIAGLLPVSSRANLTELQIIFSPGKITGACAADFHGVKLIITAVVAPILDAEGLLNLNMRTVKVGAMNVTPVARIIGRRKYAGRNDFDPNDIRSLFAASFFDNKSFDPVFAFGDKKIRLTQISVADEKMALHFVPVVDATAATLK
mgnify:CR=1 FL=1